MQKISIVSIIILLSIIIVLAEDYPDIGLKKAGVKLGLVIPDSPYDVGFALALTGDLGKLHEIVGIEAAIEYMRMTKTEYNDVYHYARSDLSAIVTVKLMPQPKQLPFRPYLGGGLGIHHIFETVNIIESPPSKTELELHIAIGATKELSEGIEGVFTFKVNLADISTYNPYIGVAFDL